MPMKNLVKTIQNTIFQQALFARGAKIVVGVSGGPDSTCLLDVLKKLESKYDLQLLIAHVNYGLREKDSDKDEKFVRNLAQKNNLKIEVLQVKVSSKQNLENNLRDIRYDFFEKIRKENKFDLIAVAHNSDDQVETYLMRIIRGAGLQGLSAMRYKNNRIIRPLLNVSRKEILEHLAKTERTYRTDRTNAENLFLRNKIRNKLIPYLEKNFNPSIRKTIFDSTVSIAEDFSFINEMAEKAYRKNKDLSAKKIMTLLPALQKRVLLQAIAEKKQGCKDIELPHIEEILKAIRSTKNKNQTVSFQGLKMTRKGDKVTMSYK